MSFYDKRPSPLDSLRNQGNISNQYNETKYQQNDPSNVFYKSANDSSVSFETILTTDRLLDKLDLTSEDEKLLQQALLEEEEKKKQLNELQDKEKLISVPASGFPSLRNRNNVSSRTVPTMNTEPSFNDKSLSLRNNKSSGNVQQHFSSKSRYSYFVEEDSDHEDFLNNIQNLPNRVINQDRIHPYRNIRYENSKIKQVSNNEKLVESDKHHDINKHRKNMVNFEKYRFRNPLYHKGNNNHNIGIYHDSGHQNEDYTADKKHPNTHGLFKNQNSSNQKSSLERNQRSINSNNSNNSFRETLSKPSTNSSFDSDLSLYGPAFKGQSTSDTIMTPSPATPVVKIIDSSSSLGDLTNPIPSHKTHKKKSSFSLRNLFRSPRSSKTSLHAANEESYFTNVKRNSPDQLHTTDTLYIEKKRNSPIRHESYTREVGYGNNNVEPSRKKTMGHIRSVSDISYAKSNYYSEPAQRVQSSHTMTNVEERRLSLGSSVKETSYSFITPKNSYENDPGLEFKTPILKSEPTLDSSNDIEEYFDFQGNNIEKAIQMRQKGKIIESTEKLRLACLTGNKTAFLLYGLALRNGYGTAKNYKASFHYIREAAGIQSENDEIFKLTIDPFELENGSSIPTEVAEPLVPALYECGISYLKGYGVPQQDELKGLKYLEKAGSLGHIDSMCLSGTIWSKHSDFHEKDIKRAASWFRLAEKRGANLIGSEWIHRDKYKRI
ncbi:hypothetical protein Kpol_1036p44 [Vanderwaltozyma polyspora DSM 70294]|uniref:Protein DSF2 n=1 Tax=Vanderwaltozyma polyspora (strain ATCC 22028 / DSM 70294 / BCRC 21397 / CBS 2163 / NBRC 10782 / NRRL Y-8283 / UCD 57-17) TaxID=436907 RepID=A7TEJ4_VANPO|nr:uncharacterized protein Kpol_1036p44 [Vanderwaltozyma polyspora DSM 70294]EDO19301.1 hypothetical protein Kpol_1036p44 [Vanderwaltozyma polyspora DSM 70294]